MQSKFRGVIWNKSVAMWQCVINVGSHGIDFGFFEKEEDAARRFNEEVKEYLGNNTKLNII